MIARVKYNGKTYNSYVFAYFEYDYMPQYLVYNTEDDKFEIVSNFSEKCNGHRQIGLLNENENSFIYKSELQLNKGTIKKFKGYSWVDNTLYIKSGIFEGKRPEKCRDYNGKPVYNKDWYYGIDALEVGDLVEEDIVNELINCLPPRSTRENCTQLGEPYSHEVDADGNCKPTFATFKRVAESTWEFCGNCFGGKSEAVKSAA